MKTEKIFPNGFVSWMETHHEVVLAIGEELEANRDTGIVNARYSEQGRGGMYELAEELTDEFELLNEGRQWDGQFFDEIDAFLQQKLK